MDVRRLKWEAQVGKGRQIKLRGSKEWVWKPNTVETSLKYIHTYVHTYIHI